MITHQEIIHKLPSSHPRFPYKQTYYWWSCASVSRYIIVLSVLISSDWKRPSFHQNVCVTKSPDSQPIWWDVLKRVPFVVYLSSFRKKNVNAKIIMCPKYRRSLHLPLDWRSMLSPRYVKTPSPGLHSLNLFSSSGAAWFSQLRFNSRVSRQSCGRRPGASTTPRSKKCTRCWSVKRPISKTYLLRVHIPLPFRPT